MRILAVVWVLIGFVVGPAVYLVNNSDTVTIDDEVVLVTIDALPDRVVIVKTGPDPAVRVVRTVRPAAPRAQPAAPAGSAAPMPLKAPPKAVTLPAPCETIKWYASKFTHEQLEAMRVAKHIPKPSPEQAKLIDQCLAS